MTSKRIYKVTLTGWVVKNEDDSEVNEWTKESILDAIVGEQLMVNFIDSNDMVVTPTRSDVVPEKRKPGRPPKVNKTEAEDDKAKALKYAAVYGAGDKKLEELEEKWDGIIQEANVDNTDKYPTDPAQEGRDAVKADEEFEELGKLILASQQPGTNSQDPDGPVYDESEVIPGVANTVGQNLAQEALDLIEAKDEIDKRQADESDGPSPLVMEFEGDDEEADDSEMSL